MKTEVSIFQLRGNFAAIRSYANVIASIDNSASNAYVMAFDKDDEVAWCIQAGDGIDEVKAAINWQGVRRVEIYDHSVDVQYKTEQVFVTCKKALDAYTSERSSDDFVVSCNRSKYTFDGWQADEPAQQDDTNESQQGDDTNEGTPEPSEPSRLVQMAGKVARKVKIYATRAAFFVTLFAVAVLCFSIAVFVVSTFGALLDVAGINGGARFFLILCAFIPATDVASWCEYNALVVVDRLFPYMCTGRTPKFLAPGSFFWHVCRGNIA